MSTIKAIIFDVDGTLYEPIEELSTELHRYWIVRMADFLRIPESHAEDRYQELKSIHKSTTLAFSSLGMGSPKEIIKQAEHHLRPFHKEYITKDRKLIQILKKLKHHYRLATLRNGTRAETQHILSLIGFSKRRDKRSNGFGPFDYILPTVELGPTKPAPEPFKNALRQLPYKPEEILIIGDRVEVDLAPAKQFGMKTALVTWGETTTVDTKVVDSIMESIYDVEQLIP